jgi:hypothetical protein
MTLILQCMDSPEYHLPNRYVVLSHDQ